MTNNNLQHAYVMVVVEPKFQKTLFSLTPRVLSPFRGGGIAYLNDPDSFAGWNFYTPVRTSQARQVEG